MLVEVQTSRFVAGIVVVDAKKTRRDFESVSWHGPSRNFLNLWTRAHLHLEQVEALGWVTKMSLESEKRLKSVSRRNTTSSDSTSYSGVRQPSGDDVIAYCPTSARRTWVAASLLRL